MPSSYTLTNMRKIIVLLIPVVVSDIQRFRGYSDIDEEGDVLQDIDDSTPPRFRGYNTEGSGALVELKEDEMKAAKNYDVDKNFSDLTKSAKAGKLKVSNEAISKFSVSSFLEETDSLREQMEATTKAQIEARTTAATEKAMKILENSQEFHENFSKQEQEDALTSLMAGAKWLTEFETELKDQAPTLDPEDPPQQVSDVLGIMDASLAKTKGDAAEEKRFIISKLQDATKTATEEFEKLKAKGKAGLADAKALAEAGIEQAKDTLAANGIALPTSVMSAVDAEDGAKKKKAKPAAADHGFCR